VRRIAISGLVALATVLGGVAIPATAMAQPTSGVHSIGAVVTRAAGPARPADGGGGGIFGGVPKISCVLATDCVAVEGTSSLSGEGTTAPTRVARWNGKSWKNVGVALPKGAKSADLEAVSCKSATSCLVVGDYYKSTKGGSPYPLALIYNGTSVKPAPAVPLPKGATYVTLSDVSCATTKYCVAIATTESNVATVSNSGPVILIETWNGAKWTLHTIATSVKSEVEPSAVSCATASFCVLAGALTTLSGADKFTFGLYLGSWNGRTLTRMKAPAEGGGNDLVEPGAVSCATPANCGVTGVVLVDPTSSNDNLTVTAFTQIWNGKTWQAGKVALLKGAQSIFLGVSCHGANSCETVGESAASASASSGSAMAVSYKGAAGTVQAVPAPAKGRSTVFTDVSCLPGGTCVATGWTGKSNAATPSLMTGVWGGKSWKLDPGF
jgi:hypothetical protein